MVQNGKNGSKFCRRSKETKPQPETLRDRVLLKPTREPARKIC